jgi:hypothetical protein
MALGPSTAVALIISVLLPAAGGALLLKPNLFGNKRVAANKADLRQRTLEAEVLALAAKKEGKLTIVEVVTDMAVTPEEAKSVLDALAVRGMADFQVTDSGVVVYDFQDIRRLGDKSAARGILDD